MEKVAFIVDGGYFVKQYKKTYKSFPTADDVEKYISKIFRYIEKNHDYPIAIYRIFYYDCPPLDPNKLLKKKTEENFQPVKNHLKNMGDASIKTYKAIKNFMMA